jgi:hypothetical protein
MVQEIRTKKKKKGGEINLREKKQKNKLAWTQENKNDIKVERRGSATVNRKGRRREKR